MSIWRPEFEVALRMFAEISEEMAAAGASRPILVGGAAVEFYSASRMMTGDFDVVTPRDDLWVEVLRRRGFEQPHGFGSLRGWTHPELGFGFEVVGSALMESRADSSRVRVFLIDDDAEHAGDDEGEGKAYSVIPVEDLIADRVGQYHSGSARETLAQAQTLYNLYNDLNLSYLEQRIREETLNELGIDILAAPSGDAHV